MKAPIANGDTKPAASDSPKPATGNPRRQPNQSLTCENLGVPAVPKQDHPNQK